MPPAADETPDWLRFSVDSHLVGELGQRLVERNHIALAELIKNSYDADATRVTVRFENATIGDELGRIEVSDDGHGMTFADVKQYWMRVATPNKELVPDSPGYGRPKAGSKGIGRFACERLAAELELVAVGRLADRSLQRTTLRIRWADYVPGTDLTEIPNRVTVDSVQGIATGLTLRLEGLREPWGPRDFNVLRRQLITLTAPHGEERPGHEEDPGFAVRLEAPEFEDDPRPIGDQVMDAGWGRIKVTVSSSGRATFKLEALGLGAFSYAPEREEPLLKGLHADLAFIPRKKTRYRRPDILSEGVASELLDDFGGVRVYLDGFRVYPYGEPGNDWLDLAKESAASATKVADHLRGVAEKLAGVNPSRARLNRPRNDQLFGGVELGRSKGSGFIVKANREGFVETPAVAALKELCRDALDWTALYYTLYLVREKDSEVQALAEEIAAEAGQQPTQRDPTEAALVVVGNAVRQLKTNPTEEVVVTASRQIDKAARIIETHYDQARDELGTLRVTASLGVLMLAFSHDVRSVLATLASITSELERLSESEDHRRRKELSELSVRVEETRIRLENQLSFWGLLTRLAGNKKREPVPVAASLASVKKGFGDLLPKHPVELDISSIPLDLLSPPMIEGEFYSIALNLISNALKAVWASETGKGVRVRARRTAGQFILDVIDDGVPVPSSYFTHPPEVYTPDPEGTIYPALRKRFGGSELESLGTGTGLGLSIVQSIASSYGGRFRFRPISGPWTKIAEVSIPE